MMMRQTMRWALLLGMLALPALASAQMRIGGSQSNFGSRRLRGGFTPDPVQVSVTSGGNIQASQAARPSCAGWVSRNPDYIVRYRRPAALLRFFAESSSDITIVVNDPNGNWHCNDDRWGTNPGIDITNPGRGQYDIWVGSYNQGQNASATLSITELQSVTPANGNNNGGTVQVPPSNNSRLVTGGRQANFGRSNLNAGFMPDPSRIQVTSGGSIRADSASQNCRGYVTAQPDHILQFNGRGGFLRILAAAQQGDITLVVNDPQGRWHCNDDRWGRNPGIDFNNAPSGQYDIWVGSYRSGQHISATLGFTELSSVEASALLGNNQAQPQPQPNFGVTYTFNGSFESTPVIFRGNSYDDINRQCQQFLSAARLRMVDDVTVNGSRVHNSSSYWNNQALCAIATINTTSSGAAMTTARGSVEDVPFQVSGDLNTVRRVLQTYLLQALQGNNFIDDITINGRAMHNSSGYWNASQAATMVSSQVH